MESVERSRSDMINSGQLSGGLSATGQEEHPLEVFHPVTLECTKATDVLEARVESDSDHDTVVSLKTKRAAVGLKSSKSKCQKKCDLKMSAEELNETKKRIANDVVTAVREIKHNCYRWVRRKKKIQTSNPVVHKIPSFESGMQIVEHHGTQKPIKLGKIQIDLIALDDILAVFPHLRSGGSEVQTLDSSNCNSLETTDKSIQAVVVKRCQDVEKRMYHYSEENANPWMKAPHFYFCDAQVEGVRVIVSKFRISISVFTSRISRPWSPSIDHPLRYLPESCTDINNHHSVNPWRAGIRMSVPPPPNGWFPNQDTD